jgi:hypothetical protein
MKHFPIEQPEPSSGSQLKSGEFAFAHLLSENHNLFFSNDNCWTASDTERRSAARKLRALPAGIRN